MADSNDCDAAALRAALVAVDDWDGDLSSLCGLSSGYSSGSDVGLPKKPRARPATAPYTAKQRKQEIAALRVEVQELQNVVALERSLDDNVSETKTSELTEEETALDLEWERLASTQKQERFVAELENVRLRKLLHTQTKNAAKILSLTKRVKLLEDAIPTKDPPSFQNYRMPYVDYEAQLERIDSLAPRAVEIFSSGVFAKEGHLCFRDLLFHDTTPAVKGVDFEIAAAWVLPFPVARIADALWLQTTRPSFRVKEVAFKDVYEDANSEVSQFIATTAAAEEWGGSHGQTAARMFPPDPIDGSILIGVTTNARAYISSKWAATAHVNGWLQVKSVASTDSSQPLTQVKWHRRTTLQPPDNAEMTNSQRCKWSFAVTSGPSRSRFEKDIEWTLQAIENLLLSPKA